MDENVGPTQRVKATIITLIICTTLVWMSYIWTNTTMEVRIVFDFGQLVKKHEYSNPTMGPAGNRQNRESR